MTTKKIWNTVFAAIAGAFIGGATVLCAHTAFATDDSKNLDIESKMYQRIYVMWIQAEFTADDMENLMDYVDSEVREQVAEELGSTTMNRYIAEFAENDPLFRSVIIKFLSENEEAL